MNVRKSTCILLFFLLPMTIVEYFKLPPFTERVWFYLAILGAILMALKYRKIYMPILSVLLVQIVYYSFQQYSTGVSGGEVLVDILQVRQFTFMTITLMCLIGVYQHEVIRVLNRIFVLCYTINLFTVFAQMVKYKTVFLTADEVYFMGYRYIFCAFSVVSLATAYYCRRFSEGENFLYKYLFSALWLTAITVGPSTLLGGLIVYSAILLANKKNLSIGSFQVKLSTPILVIGAVLIDVGIVFFNVQESFAFLIETVLNREATFTGRSTIWETSIRAFLKGDFWRGLGNSLAFGYNGWGNLGWEEQKFSAHNQILTILTNTGAIGLIIEFVFFVIILVAILKIQDKDLKYALSASYVSMIVMSISTQLIPFRFIEIFAMIVIFISREHSKHGEAIVEHEYYSY